MDIGWPTNVRHIAHVTFDRFNGFLGLPMELELEVPNRVPSASASVFGVSAESMQCSFDGRGNSVPTILLLLQERLYEQGGLQAEGIFRINPNNSQEEQVRDHLNKGIVPYDIDVHCLAGLIKAWFRELPKGVLDTLTPQQVMDCHSEDQCIALIRTLPPTEAALLNWAINLMADVVEQERLNKMNARNVAMVFAPNMTQMLDPLTALMHAVQVMNLLKTLIIRTIKDREAHDAGTPSSKDEHHNDDDVGGLQKFDSKMKKLDSEMKSLASEGGEESSVGEAKKASQSPYFPERLSGIRERRDEDDEMSLESRGLFSSRSRSSSTWSSIDANLGAADDEDKPDEMHVTCVNDDMRKLSIGKKTPGSGDDSDSHTESFAVCPGPGSVRTHKAKAKVGGD